MHIDMQLVEPWFSYAKDGSKTIVVQIAHKQYTNVQRGDTITLIDKHNRRQRIKKSITFVHEYRTPQQLIERETIKRTFPGETRRLRGVNIIKNMFGEREIGFNGLVAIGITDYQSIKQDE